MKAVDKPKSVIRIAITEEHIERGKKCNSFACPAALALRDALPEYCYHKVCVERVTVGAEEIGYFAYRLSNRLIDFIRRFDDGMKVKPIEFSLFLAHEC